MKLNYSVIFMVMLAVFLGSLMRATFGFGDSVISMPILALLPIPFSTSVALVGLVGFTVALFFAVSGWKDKDSVVLKKLSISTVIGIPFGLLLVRYASQQWISGILGFLLMAYAIFSLTRSQDRQRELNNKFSNTNTSYLFGFASGMLGSAYNMNGIPVVLYATMRDWSPKQFTGNVQSHFIVSSMLIIFSHFFSGFWTRELFVYYLFSIPAVLAAIVLGNRIYAHIKANQFIQYVFYIILLLGLVNFAEIFKR